MALGGKLAKKDFRVYVLLGDGELNEGQVWEAAMAAAKYKLDNLVAIVDYNRLQVDGFVDEVMPLEPLAAKWKAFNWHVCEIDGHNIAEILSALAEARATANRPTCIIAHTVKGKGVSFMENKVEWHGMAPDDAQLEQALAELGVK
jgi:transketolase